MAAERVATEGGKEGKKKEVREKKKAEKSASGGGGGDKGRVVAVDWALSQEEWKKAQEGEAASGSEADEESGSGSDSGSSDDEDEDDSDMSPVPEDLDADSDMSPEPVGAAERRRAEHKDDGLSDEGEEDKPQQQKGTTLFVRNMSFEATEAELYDLCVPSFLFPFVLSSRTLTSPLLALPLPGSRRSARCGTPVSSTTRRPSARAARPLCAFGTTRALRPSSTSRRRSTRAASARCVSSLCRFFSSFTSCRD